MDDNEKESYEIVSNVIDVYEDTSTNVISLYGKQNFRVKVSIHKDFVLSYLFL